MSIRKRIILSNMAMVLVPVVLFTLAIVLFSSIMYGDIHVPWSGTNPKSSTEQNDFKQLLAEIRKVASLTPERFLQSTYITDISEKLREHDSLMIVRKGNDLLFASPQWQNVAIEELPAYGIEASPWTVHWINHNRYSLYSYEFYFSDGTLGVIYIASELGWAWGSRGTLFPVLFAFFLFILIATNGLLSYFLSKSILTPVQELNRAAQRISEGDLHFHIQTDQKDELGKLLQTFDHMRQKLKDSIEAQLQHEEHRKELIAHISHDLKTPITSIKGYVEGIRDGVANTPEKLERYLHTIYTKSVYMDTLIDELALFSKLDMQRMPYHFEEVNIRSFLHDVLDELKLDLEKASVTVTFLDHEIDNIHVWADREKTKRVVTNILSNSVKYMDKEDKHIEICLLDWREHIAVRIRDNGPGISEKNLPFIFDRFYRADPSRNSNTGGSGLGLAIAKRIVEDHGGEIWAKSNGSDGTSITFTLRKVSKSR